MEKEASRICLKQQLDIIHETTSTIKRWDDTLFGEFFLLETEPK